jgi:hypothetical protein
MKQRILAALMLISSFAAVATCEDFPWWPFNTYRKNSLIYQNLVDRRAFASADEMTRSTDGNKILVTKNEIDGLIQDIDYLMHSRCYHSVPRAPDADAPECRVLSPQETQDKQAILAALNRALAHCWSLPRSSDEFGCYLP